jgi:hypothetical protein
MVLIPADFDPDECLGLIECEPRPRGAPGDRGPALRAAVVPLLREDAGEPG